MTAPVAVPDWLNSAKAHQKAYWTLFAGPQYPQVEIAGVPMTTKSKVANVESAPSNNLLYTSAITFYKGHLWVLSFGTSHGSPNSVLEFDLPLKPKSKPHRTFVLGNTSGGDAIAFDPKGHLWVSSVANNDLLQYEGPFQKSGTLQPAATISGGTFKSYAIAFNKAGTLYVSVNDGGSSNSIAVLKPPYKGKPFFLTGLTNAGAVAADNDGNLYASTNGPSSAPALVRYNANNIKKGAKPDIIDTAGLPANSYLAGFAFTSKGDLYVANCGNAGSAGIDVYPLSKKTFSAHLRPSVEYTNADITGAGCAWGIAIH
ncbi:MAG: hypothetical protein JO092_11500 [Candidatus Eremiobacteraeota bacterium]|nr:hypothetical protein [Candidatus Eremiobacteraeota bacterium]